MSAIRSITVNTASTANTPIVIGVSTFTSIPDGRGFLRSRAKKARISSAIATAICPPSSGSSGNKLKSPTKILRLAIKRIKVPIRSVLLYLLLLTASPETRAAPTMPTSPLGSRFSWPKVCRINCGTLVGRATNDFTDSRIRTPLALVVSFVA